MIALIRKEWRENRWLVWAFVVLAPLLSLGLKHFLVGWEKVRPDQTFSILLPGVVALYVMALGADLVAGDAGSGRISFLAALPVRPAKVWAAKVIFLFASATLFTGYVLAAESMICSAAGIDVWSGFTDAQAQETATALVFVVALGAAVVFWSTLIDRGLAAVFAALLTLAAFGFGMWFAFLSRYSFKYATLGDVATPPAVLAGGLLLGSFLAFARGRIHLGCRVRRLALALGALTVVLVAPGAVAAVRLDRWATIRPTDTNVRYADDPTADPWGEWIVLHVARSGVGPFGAAAGPGTPGRSITRCWAIRLTDGAVRDLTASGRLLTFPEPGVARLVRGEEVPDEEGKIVWLESDVDLASGKVLHTRTRQDPNVSTRGRFEFAWTREDGGHYRILRDGGDPIDLPPRWMPIGGFGPVGLVVYGPDGSWEVRLVDENRRVHFPSGPWATVLLPSETRGSALGLHRTGAYDWRAGTPYDIDRVPLDGEDAQKVGSVRGLSLATSPDGRRGIVKVLESPELVLLDADRGVTRLTMPGETDWRTRATWAPDSESFLLSLGERWIAVDLGGEKPEVRSVELGVRPGLAAWFDGRRALVLDDGRDDLWFAEVGAAPRRLLPSR